MTAYDVCMRGLWHLSQALAGVQLHPCVYNPSPHENFPGWLEIRIDKSCPRLDECIRLAMEELAKELKRLEVTQLAIAPCVAVELSWSYLIDGISGVGIRVVEEQRLFTFDVLTNKPFDGVNV